MKLVNLCSKVWNMTTKMTHQYLLIQYLVCLFLERKWIQLNPSFIWQQNVETLQWNNTSIKVTALAVNLYSLYITYIVTDLQFSPLCSWFNIHVSWNICSSSFGQISRLCWHWLYLWSSTIITKIFCTFVSAGWWGCDVFILLWKMVVYCHCLWWWWETASYDIGNNTYH